MKQYQRKIEEYKSLIQKEYIRETAVHTVKERCSDILNRQDNRRASYFEFLFEQFKFNNLYFMTIQHIEKLVILENPAKKQQKESPFCCLQTILFSI
jgi:CRISPR/Cas system CMR subunit Cmr6 (Cas7 group RAMP superfamily)